MPGLGEALKNRMGEIDGGRHEHVGLAAGIAEHDALVAGALVLVPVRIDALGDIDRLGVQQDLDIGVLPVEAVLFVTDGLDGVTGDVLEQIEGDRRRARTSPAMTTLLVVANVSQATRASGSAAR